MIFDMYKDISALSLPGCKKFICHLLLLVFVINEFYSSGEHLEYAVVYHKEDWSFFVMPLTNGRFGGGGCIQYFATSQYLN
jgi:hypothetical protein